MIREATIQDLKEIMTIVRAVVKLMRERGSVQWDDSYPTEADYLKDINKRELFVYLIEDKIVGVYAISQEGHSEYPSINWASNVPAWTLKRIALNPDYHGRGIADQLMRFAEEHAKANGVYRINTDTYRENLHAQKVFKRHGYQLVDKRTGRRGTIEFFYFEKILSKGEE